MENFATQRFDGRIEGFEDCMIDGANQQDIPQELSSGTNAQEEDPQPTHEEVYEQAERIKATSIKKRKSGELDSGDVLRVSRNNTIVVEDEIDAIGRNVAAKLRHVRLD
ncbi:hypothetical protein QAD02_020651 [Eretmocerus hayati]|uniref:Uncharacterized protein n=1 Tax=Eretmocerus hayati TaxID=131215 RepID=A0ACC2PP15_9HYME|nr:hypothetical protein QAD02_020651 [Eretmocerus hayati]